MKQKKVKQINCSIKLQMQQHYGDTHHLSTGCIHIITTLYPLTPNNPKYYKLIVTDRILKTDNVILLKKEQHPALFSRFYTYMM